MKRNWLNFAAALTFGAFIFTACESEVTLTAPADATIDLGADFDERAGIIVDGAKAEDVQVLWVPAFNNNRVDHYVATYTVDGVNDQRNVYVRSNLLTGAYRASDVIEGASPITYNVEVKQSSQEFNRILLEGIADFNIEPYATINGSVITIPLQTPSNWTSSESIEGTGTYNGEAKSLSTINYTIKFLDGGNIVTENGVATFTRR
jgi:hypothetical protein